MRERRREQRRAKRSPRRNAAWIAPASGGTHIPCVLWDISDTGARLAAPRPNVLPAAFRLLLTKDGRSQRCCRVVWRNERQLGVKFVEASAEDMEADASALRRLPKLVNDRTAGPARPPAARPIDPASLLLPGCGPHVPARAVRRGSPISSIAASMLFALIAATAALLVAAGMPGVHDMPWAVQLCTSAANFCRHPEWTGVAAGLMAVVYFAARGMED